MKSFFTLIIIAFGNLIFAQTAEKRPPYVVGDHHVQLGLGYPNLASAAIVGLRAIGDYTEQTNLEGKFTPTIVFSYDFG